MEPMKTGNPVNVREYRGVAIVEFDNGVIAEFVPYSHGFGYQIEGLRNFELFKDEMSIFKYNARLYRCGPQNDENCVASMNKDITQEIAAEYWKKARDFVISKFYPKGRDGENYKIHDDNYWYHWKVIAMEGYFDLERLSKGKCKILEVEGK